MFCHKCGTQITEEAAFCHKCGARLIVDSPVVQEEPASMPAREEPVSTPVQETPQPDRGTPEAQPKKKSKLPLILGGIAALVLVVVLIAAGGNKDDSLPSSRASNGGEEQPAVDYLTYTNEEEGISFKYPSFWEEGALSEAGVYFSDERLTMITYLLAPTVDGPKLPIMNVRKAPVTQEVINEIFSATLSTIQTEGNMLVTDIEDVAINELPARRFTLSTKTDDGGDTLCIRYVYFINSFQYRIEFYSSAESLESIEGFIEDIIDSYAVTAGTSGLEPAAEPSPDLPAARFPLATSTDAQKLFDEWAAAHPMVGTCHLDLISDDSTDSSGEKAFLFTLETEGMGMFNMTIRKSDGYMEYISKLDSMSLDGWYEEWYADEPAAADGPASGAPDTPCYNGTPLMDFFDYSPEEIYAVLGQPDYGTPVTGELLYGGTEFFGYDDIGFELYSGAVSTIRASAGCVTFNGSTLDKTRAEIIGLIGEAFYEDSFHDDSGEFGDYYFMQFLYGGGGTIIQVEFPDAGSAADIIQIFRYTDGI